MPECIKKHNIILGLLLTFTTIAFSQNATLTEAQKNELINYNYDAYVNNQKTISEFLTNIPHVNTTNNLDYGFSRQQTSYLNGIEIYFTCNNEDFIITLFVRDLNHDPNKKYDSDNPWDMNTLKLESINYITIQDMSSDEYSGLVKHIE